MYLMSELAAKGAVYPGIQLAAEDSPAKDLAMCSIQDHRIEVLRFSELCVMSFAASGAQSESLT